MELLHAAADGTLSNGDQETVRLGELRIVQAVKQILNVYLKRTVRWARLSHAFSEHLETPLTRESQWLRWLARCSLRMSGAGVPFPPGA